jgi:hypothetical protein
MSGVRRGLKEYEVTGLQLFKPYGFSQLDLLFGRARQIDIEGIPVDRFHKPGAIDSPAAGSAHFMVGTLPALIFFDNSFFY